MFERNQNSFIILVINFSLWTLTDNSDLFENDKMSLNCLKEVYKIFVRRDEDQPTDIIRFSEKIPSGVQSL